MVLVQNKYKNTLVGVLRTKITFVTHSSPSCYVTLRTQVIRLNSGNLGPQKIDSGVFIIVSLHLMSCVCFSLEMLDKVDPPPVPDGYAISTAFLCLLDVVRSVQTLIDHFNQDPSKKAITSSSGRTIGTNPQLS